MGHANSEDAEDAAAMSPAAAMAAAASAAAAWGSPGASPPWLDQESMMGADFSNVHAMNATTAAFHADVAAKHAASLAQWVQYLQYSLAGLQNKVTELESWKKNALEDVRKLREEHKVLRRKVLGDAAEEPMGLPAKSKSSPMVTSMSSESEAKRSLTDSPAVHKVDTSSSQEESFGLPSSFSLPSDISFSEIEAGQLEGVTVVDGEVEGSACVRAEWRIGHLSTKLRGCMGRALVSSPFTAAGLEDLRLMICPDGKESQSKGPRSRRQKELYAKKVMEGPLDGCLKLKAPNSSTEGAPQEIEYYLKVGSKRMGPIKHKFSESTVSGCEDFGVDWLKQLEVDLSLTVCVEILK